MMDWIGGSTASEELAALSPWTQTAAPIAAPEYRARAEAAQRALARAGQDALLVGAGPTLHYFTGLSWGPTERLVAWLLPAEGDPVFICPTFELGSLEASVTQGAEALLWEEDENPHRRLAAHLSTLGARRLAVDPAFDFGGAERLRAAAEGVALSDAAPVVDALRSVKSDAEIALLQQAKSMTLEVHRRTARILRPGITASEVRRFIDEAHRSLGAAGSSFCIVLFGEATSYPHGVPGEQTLKEGDVVLVDTGCLVDGYHSDITRTYVYGEPEPDFARAWAAEREAELAAFAAAKPGATCGAVDRAARAVLEEAGYGPGFALPGLPHRTGHGVGLSIHEAPYLVPGDETVLEPGVCVSNEPMLVIPNRFGVRLEDHMRVTADGAAWFTEPAASLERPFG